MAAFAPRAVRLAGGFTVATGPDAAFTLFSPLGERAWVPEWAPELIHPSGIDWAEGQIFKTREELGEAVWVVARLDRAERHVEYYRVEPARYVAHIIVECTPASERTTEVSVVYEFVALSERGNSDIAAMTDEGYSEKMARWSKMIATALQTER